jgi:tRNA G18 (ribose-2'-O)-methylase SpoU
MIRIEDAGDERLADYRLLNDQAARRHHEGDQFFIAEGFVAIGRAIDTGYTLRSVLLAPSKVARFESQLPALDDAGVPVYVVERDVLADTVGFSLHRGVLASAQRRAAPTIEELAVNARRLALIEGLNDPENVGAIARAARALGIDGLLLDPRCTDAYSRRTVRVSMGEILALPVARASDWPGAIGRLHAHGFETWAMTPATDADDLWRLNRPERLAVVLGAEGPGLDPATIECTTRRVRIPIDAAVDSLNVGHAAAITFAAIARPVD